MDAFAEKSAAIVADTRAGGPGTFPIPPMRGAPAACRSVRDPTAWVNPSGCDVRLHGRGGWHAELRIAYGVNGVPETSLCLRDQPHHLAMIGDVSAEGVACGGEAITVTA